MKKLTVLLLMLIVAGLGVLSAQDLFSAIERGSPQLVRQAIRKSGVDIDTPSSWGTTPLIYAAMMHDDLEIVRILLEAGADVNAVDSGGYTALMEAVLNSNTPMVSLLLAHGADVHSRDSLGMTALMHAAQTSPFAQIIRNLVDAGADPDGRSHDGRTPLMYAAGNNANPAIVEALLDSPVDVDARAASGRTALSFASELSFSPEVVKLLVEAGADMEIRDYELGRTPLFWAVKNSPDMLALLVSLGADVRTTDNAGDTILHRILWYYPEPDMVELLVASGADVHHRNGEGMTALMVAARSGSADDAVLHVLVQAGADPGELDELASSSGGIAMDEQFKVWFYETFDFSDRFSDRAYRGFMEDFTAFFGSPYDAEDRETLVTMIQLFYDSKGTMKPVR